MNLKAARQFASLDQISGGRAGWNLVTSNNEDDALNYSLEQHPAHADRYERAIEFAEVVTGLWDSWDEDAFIRDKDVRASSSIRRSSIALHHKGKHFQVRGPLNVALLAAGTAGAGPGRRLGHRARCRRAPRRAGVHRADHLRAGQGILRRRDGRLPRFGRSPAEVLVMPGLYPVVAPTESEAQEKSEYLQSLIHPSVGLAVLEHTIGVHDLDKLPLDGPVPEMPDTNGPLSRQRLLLDQARRDKLTLWELCLANAGAARTCPHHRHTVAGRRRDGALVQGRRRRRLQRDAGTGCRDRSPISSIS